MVSKMLEFSKWPLATFPPPAGGGQGPRCILGDWGATLIYRAFPCPLAHTKTSPGDAATQGPVQRGQEGWGMCPLGLPPL
jgi:hypothetical protein